MKKKSKLRWPKILVTIEMNRYVIFESTISLMFMKIIAITNAKYKEFIFVYILISKFVFC